MGIHAPAAEDGRLSYELHTRTQCHLYFLCIYIENNVPGAMYSPHIYVFNRHPLPVFDIPAVLDSACFLKLKQLFS